MPRWRRKSSGARAGHCCHIKRNSSTQSKSIASQVAPDIVVPQVPNIRHCTVIGPSSCLKFPKAPWLYTVEFAGNPSTHTPPSAGTSLDLSLGSSATGLLLRLAVRNLLWHHPQPPQSPTSCSRVVLPRCMLSDYHCL